jgi:hypothetical protein
MRHKRENVADMVVSAMQLIHLPLVAEKPRVMD